MPTSTPPTAMPKRAIVTALIVGFLLGGVTVNLLNWRSESTLQGRAGLANPASAQRSFPNTNSVQKVPHPSMQQQMDESPAESLATRMERRMHQAAIEQATLARQPLDSEFLRGLGVAEAEIDRYNSNRVHLHALAIQAGTPMQELVVRRTSLKRELLELMGPDSYAKYRAYEEAKPARREWEQIRDFASANSRDPLSPEVEHQVVQAIRTLKAETTESWDGPFDPVPSPMAGSEMITPVVQGWIDKSRKAMAALPAMLKQNGVNENAVNVIVDYYASRAEGFTKLLASLEKPDPTAEDLRAAALRRKKGGQ